MFPSMPVKRLCSVIRVRRRHRFHSSPSTGPARGGPDPARDRGPVIPEQEWRDARVVWDYHRMGHAPRPCSVAVGLGSHDLGVATAAVEAYRAGLVPLIVFTGANSPTTRARFPEGEAVAYRRHALDLGVPPEAVLVEPRATNTGQNITYARRLLEESGAGVSSVLLVSKPYEQRRAYATARKLWDGVDVVCVSAPMEFSEYVDGIGDARLVIDMLVGALQRLVLYPRHGFMIEQEVPGDVLAAYRRLCRAGFTSRLVAEGGGAGPGAGVSAGAGASAGSSTGAGVAAGPGDADSGTDSGTGTGGGADADRASG